MPAILDGYIRFGSDAVAFVSATIVVILEDTTYADAAAVPVARIEVEGAVFDGRPQTRIPFQIERVLPPAGHVYTLRVLIDLDGDGRASPGDYVSRQSVPVGEDTSSGVVIDVARIRPR